MPGLPATDALDDVRNAPDTIRQYQLVQAVSGRVRVKIVRGNNYTDEHTARIKTEVSRHGHGKLVVDVEFVDEIPATAAGKRAFVISEVTR